MHAASQNPPDNRHKDVGLVLVMFSRLRSQTDGRTDIHMRPTCAWSVGWMLVKKILVSCDFMSVLRSTIYLVLGWADIRFSQECTPKVICATQKWIAHPESVQNTNNPPYQSWQTDKQMQPLKEWSTIYTQSVKQQQITYTTILNALLRWALYDDFKGQTGEDEQTDGWTDSTKHIISPASRSIKMYHIPAI